MLAVAKLKTLLGIDTADTSKDAVLDFTLEDATETILNYCNLNELPSGLEHTAYRMAIDLYRNESLGSEDMAMAVTSITEGDTTTQFKKSADDNFKNTLLKNYEAQLNLYRRLTW